MNPSRNTKFVRPEKEEKSDRVVKQKAFLRTRGIWLSVCGLAMLASVVLAFWMTGGPSERGNAKEIEIEGDHLKVSIFNVERGSSRQFQYRVADGTTVRFMIVKTRQGTVGAALDACEVCWREGKGYVEDGGHMICKNCGRRFPLEAIGRQGGGCNPHPLRHELMGEKVIIPIQDLKEGAMYFKHARRA